MIVLDTNVLSEPIRQHPDPRVLAWLERTADDVAVTAVTVGEILTGVRALPVGRRRDGLMTAMERVFNIYADRILPYDESAARTYASLHEIRRAAGDPLAVEDGMIAAICRSQALPLATRNTKDFRHLDVTLINPWTPIV